MIRTVLFKRVLSNSLRTPFVRYFSFIVQEQVMLKFTPARSLEEVPYNSIGPLEQMIWKSGVLNKCMVIKLTKTIVKSTMIANQMNFQWSPTTKTFISCSHS